MRNLQIIDDEGLVTRAERMGKRLHEALARLGEMPHVGEVRGLGLIAGVEIVADTATREPFPPSAGVGAKIARAMRDRGLITRVKGDIILLAPPLIVSEEEVDTIVNVVAESVEAVTTVVRTSHSA